MYITFYLWVVAGLGCLLLLRVCGAGGVDIKFGNTLETLPDESRQISIEVTSSRRIFSVHVDSTMVVNCTSSAGCPPSLQVVVLCQVTGRLLDHKAFRTSLHTESMALHPYLESISPGRVLIAGVMTDAALNLPSVSRNLLKALGISSASFLEYRNYFAAVAVVGAHTLVDSFSPDLETRVTGLFGPTVIASADFVLNHKKTCVWTRAEQAKRARVCLESTGHGELCDCAVAAPTLLLPPPPRQQSPGLRDTSMLVIAGNRPSSLYRCLYTLLTQRGVEKSKFLVSIDGRYTAVEALLDLLDITYIENSQSAEEFPEVVRNSTGYKISKHYIFSLERLFETFPESDKVIVMEEDLLASPDMFDYFRQTSWLLDTDHSLYCVSAWNDLGALHTARDLSQLYRVETHPGYGWMMKKSFFESVIDEWRNITKDHDWDVWLRSPHVRAERECIIPAVSRSFHYGLSGAHVNGILTQAHFAGHLASASRTAAPLHTERLLQFEYEQRLYELLQGPSTVFLNSTLHPCHHNILPRNFTEAPVVVAFSMATSEDYTGWTRLGGCLGLWQMDTRGHHRGLFRFNYYNTSVIAIGYPFSDYSWIVPPHVHIVRSLADEEEKKSLHELVYKNRKRFRVPDLEPYIPYLVLEDSSPKPLFFFPNETLTT